jgi:hypothetical protein
VIRYSARSATLAFSKADYPRESLEAAAATLPDDVQVFLGSAGREHRVELRAARPAAARLRRLAGAYADAALSHAYRQQVVRAHGDFSSALLASVFERGFKPVPADPLEELEPQVRLDRTRDLDSLLVAAKRMGGA